MHVLRVKYRILGPSKETKICLSTHPAPQIDTFARLEQIEEERKREIAELMLIKAAQAKRIGQRDSRAEDAGKSQAESRLSRSLSPTAAAAASTRSSQYPPHGAVPSRQAGPESAVAFAAAVSAAAAGAAPLPAPKSMVSVSQSVKSVEEQEFDQLIEDSINRKEQEEEEKRREARKEARAARRAAAEHAAQEAATSARHEEQEIRQERKSRLFSFGRRSKSESSARAKRRAQEPPSAASPHVSATLEFAPREERGTATGDAGQAIIHRLLRATAADCMLHFEACRQE